MTGQDLVVMTPLLVVAATAIVLMAVVAWRRNHLATAGVALVGLLAAAVTVAPMMRQAPRQVGELLIVDSFALTVIGILVLAAAGTVVLSFAMLRRVPEVPEELYMLIVIATIGAAVLAASDHLVAVFIGLETLSVALYGAIGYIRRRILSTQASILYLIVAAVSSAFYLFGAALLYAGSGSMRLSQLVRSAPEVDPVLVAGGLGLVLVAVGFKLGAAPFHLWTPDVYRGAPAPVTAFVATVSKAGVVAVLVRTMALADGPALHFLTVAVGFLALASIVVGNLLALRERDLKRLLAYSSVAHIGYLLVAMVAGGERAVEAVLVYLVTYVVATMAAFGTVAAVTEGEDEPSSLEAYRGLAWRRPGLAVVLAASVASLAGVPLTAGFVGKLWAVLSAASGGLWVPVVVLVAGSVVGAFYYLRIVITVLAPSDDEAPALPLAPVAATVVLAVAVVVLLWFGLIPSVVVDLVGPAVRSLV